VGVGEAGELEVPLSAKEQALWLFHQYAGDVGVLNVPFAVRFTRPVRTEVLDEAVARLVSRHPALRTLFPERDGTPARVVLRAGDVRATVPVSEHLSTPESLDDDLARFTAAPFDLSSRPPIRVGRFGDVVCVAVNHLVYDAYSSVVLRREFLELCEALQGGAGVPPHLTGEVVAPASPPPDPGGADYWRRHLAGADENRAAPAIGRTGDRAPDFPGARTAIPLSTGTDAAVRSLLADETVSLNVVALAAYVLLLSRHGAGDDVVVAVPVNGRGSRPHDAVGYFMEVMALRVPVDGQATFRELVRTCQEVFLTGLMHGRGSVDEALPGAYGHDTGFRQPLLRHMFNFTGEMFQLTEEPDDGAGVVRHPVYPRHSRMDLELIVGYRVDRFEIGAAYASDVFTIDEVNALLHRYEQILRVAAAHYDDPVASIPLWTDADRAIVRRSGSALGAAPVPERFLEHALLSPGALVLGPLTRADLVHYAARLADRLRALGAGPGAVVGVVTSRDASFLTALLATWGTGAAVLPVDPREPTAGLDEAGVKVVVGDVTVEGRTVLPALPDGPPRDGLDPVAEDDIACVLPTPSGLTRVEHGALAAMAAELCDLVAVEPGDTVAWRTDPSADPAWLEPLLALTGGARLLVDERAPAGIVLGSASVPPSGARFVARGSRPPAAAGDGARVVSVLEWPETWGPALVSTGDASSYRPIAGVAASVRDGKGYDLPPGVRGALRLTGLAGTADVGLTAMWRFDGGLAVDWPATVVQAPAVVEPAAGNNDLVDELVGLYRAILKDNSLEAKDSFFANGGNSLLAARLVSQIRVRTGAKVPLRTVFRANTPTALAQAIARLLTAPLSTQGAR
jgi:hypothetical protein